MNERELEDLVDRGLKAVPPRRAPRTLLPAVMYAIRAAAERPWYARPWMTWPTTWRLASVMALLLLLVGGALAIPAAQPYLAPGLAWGQQFAAPVVQVLSSVETITTAVEIASRVIGQSVLGLVLVLFVVMLTASVAIGAAISRVALGGAYQS